MSPPHETHHAHYEHYAPGLISRLDGLYGRVEADLHRRLVPLVRGQSVLDVGCGFGSTAEAMRRAGFQAVGIDTLPEWLEAGRGRFPGLDLRLSEPYCFGVPDQSFDTVIMKEVIHHIADEGDVGRFLAEVRRVCRRRLIVVDPNPNPVLRATRALARHVDPVCSAQEARRHLEAAGFVVGVPGYSQLFTIPLSGGYVSPVRVPDPPVLGRLVVALDRAMTAGVVRLGLADRLCWRYTLTADVPG